MAEEAAERNVRSVAAIEQDARDARSFGERLIDGMTAFSGTGTFILLNAGYFVVWLALHFLVGWDPQFDALTMIVSLEAIFLALFVLSNQRRQDEIDQRRSHLDLQVNLLSEQEGTKTLQLLVAVCRHLGVTCVDGDDELRDLLERVHPEEIGDHIRVHHGQSA